MRLEKKNKELSERRTFDDCVFVAYVEWSFSLLPSEECMPRGCFEVTSNILNIYEDFAISIEGTRQSSCIHHRHRTLLVQLHGLLGG